MQSSRHLPILIGHCKYCHAVLGDERKISIYEQHSQIQLFYFPAMHCDFYYIVLYHVIDGSNRTNAKILGKMWMSRVFI